MKTTSLAGAIRANLLCVVRACTRVIYSQLASVRGCWRGLLVNRHAPTPFVQIGQGYLTRDLCVRILLHLR